MRILILASLILTLAAGVFSQANNSKKPPTTKKRAIAGNQKTPAPAQESPAKAAAPPNQERSAAPLWFGFGFAALLFAGTIAAIAAILNRQEQMRNANEQVFSTSEDSKDDDWMFYKEPPHEYDRDADD